MTGSRPSGTVTFLFTDVEGSTRLWEEHPEAMRSALAGHDEILLAAIDAHNGYVFATGGDGFAAAFHTPEDAVNAAGAAQVALLAEKDRFAVDIRVRMGIHTGSADERNADYFGQAPTRAARIMSVAWGGQVLLSAATSLLVNPDRSVSLGEHWLRDLSQSVELHQLVADGLRQDFPPPRTSDARPNNLPDQRTSFVGRDPVMSEVREALELSRLVTLVGAGGVGKTRLALEAARAMVAATGDGAWLCELATASGDEGVAGVVAAALGVRQLPGDSLLESITGFLRNRDLVLVLDNCEHVVEGAAELGEAVLAGCPSVRLLATSREGLSVRGERIVAVPPLPTSGHGDDEPVASVELFLERAVERGARREALERESETILAICSRLDGLPLAIELAAARTTSLSPADILDKLDRRFRLLTGGSRRSRDRRRTLEQAIDWSYDMLAVDERVVFCRLAVIAASFDLAMACAVASIDDISPDDVVDIVDALVARSLLLAEDAGTGATRYRYLETIRHYAEARIEDAAELDSASAAHAAHLAAWMARCARESVGPDEQRWLAELHMELPNIERLVDWATDTNRPTDVIAVLGPFAARAIRVTHMLGPIASAAVNEALLNAPGHYGVLILAAQYRGATLDIDESKRLAELAMADAGPDSFGASQAHNVWQIANLQTATSEADYALGYHHSLIGIEWARQSSDDESLVHNLTGAIFSGARAGLPADTEVAAEAYEIGQRTGCPEIISVGAFDLGITHLATGDLDEALTRFDECAATAEPDSYMSISGAMYAAIAELLLGQPRACLARAHHTIQRSQRQGNHFSSLMLAQVAAAGLAELGRPKAAAAILGRTESSPMDDLVADRLSAALHASLTQEDLDTERKRGAELDIDQLVQLVAANLDDVAEPA